MQIRSRDVLCGVTLHIFVGHYIGKCQLGYIIVWLQYGGHVHYHVLVCLSCLFVYIFIGSLKNYAIQDSALAYLNITGSVFGMEFDHVFWGLF